MTARIPVSIRITENDLPKVKSEFAALSTQEKKALNDRMRQLSFQRRVENELNRELKEQIRNRQRLVQLSEKLNRDLAKQQGRGMLGGGVLGGTAGSLLKGAAAFGLGAAAVDFTKDSFMMAAASERLEKATHNLGRQYSLTSDQIVGAIKKASQGTIAGTDAMLAANKAMLFGIVDNEKEFEELTQIAVGLGRAMGLDAKTAMDDFTTGIGRQSRLILDNLGIIVNAEEAYKAYARQLGVSVDELSNAQKQQAFTNAALEAGKVRLDELGDQQLDTAGKVEKLTAGWANFQTEFGKLADASGTLDFLNEVVDRLTEGAEAWQFVFDSAEKYNESIKRVAEQKGVEEPVIAFGRAWERPKNGAEAYLQLAKQVPITNEEIAQSWQDITKEQEEAEKKANEAAKRRQHINDIEEARIAQQEEAAKVMEEEEKRLEKVNEVREDFVREMLSINERFREDEQEAWDDYFEDEAEAWADNQERVADLRKDFAKDISKIDKDLAKDLAKNQRSLEKDLAKITKDENKQIQEAKAKAAKEEKQERRKRAIDAKADEKLFQFELRQLAAEGNANAILEALERRKIEQEIDKEKQAEEERQEEQNLQDEIGKIKEQADEKRAEAQAEAEERRAELEAQAEEEKALREEQLAEQLLQEQENYEERLADLRKHREEKLASLEEAKNEAIAKQAEELAQIEELTEAELKNLIPVAEKIGKDVGSAFAEGMKEEFERQQEIADFLGTQKSTTPSSSGGDFGTAGSSSPGTKMERFASGGSFTVGGSGGVDSQLVQFMASPKEVVTITPPSQTRQGININVNGVGADVLARLIQAKINQALDEYDDLLASQLN